MSKFETRYNKSWEGISLYADFARWITPFPGYQLLLLSVLALSIVRVTP